MNSCLESERYIVGWSDIEGAIDELKRQLILAHKLGGDGGVGQRLEVSRIEFQCLVEMRLAFIPMTLATYNEGQRPWSLRIVRPLGMDPLKNFPGAVVVVNDPVVVVT